MVCSTKSRAAESEKGNSRCQAHEGNWSPACLASLSSVAFCLAGGQTQFRYARHASGRMLVMLRQRVQKFAVVTKLLVPGEWSREVLSYLHAEAESRQVFTPSGCTWYCATSMFDVFCRHQHAPRVQHRIFDGAVMGQFYRICTLSSSTTLGCPSSQARFRCTQLLCADRKDLSHSAEVSSSR